MQQREGPRNEWLAQTGEPSGMTVRQSFRIAPHRLDKQQL